MEQVLRRARKHDGLSEKFRVKKDDLGSVQRDLATLYRHDEELSAEIAEFDSQLSKVDEIKDLYYERKSLEAQVAAAEDTIKDYRDSLGDLAEANWWLPATEILLRDYEAAESDIVAAENAYREKYKIQFKVDQIEMQIGTGICPTCNQSITLHNEVELKAELARLREELGTSLGASVDEVRRRRDRLRRFSNGASVLQRVHEQEQDLGRERLRNDKRRQRIRQISEQIQGNPVDIESLERNLIDRKALKSRGANVILGLEERRGRPSKKSILSEHRLQTSPRSARSNVAFNDPSKRRWRSWHSHMTSSARPCEIA